MNENHFRKLEHLYDAANINAQFFNEYEINVDNEKCTLKLDISEKYHHGLGAMHGAVYFKLLDDASYFAANSVVEEFALLTTSFTLHFLRPVANGKITATAKLRYNSKNLLIADATLRNEDGKEIGYGTGHFAKSRIRLEDVEGYRLT